MSILSKYKKFSRYVRVYGLKPTLEFVYEQLAEKFKFPPRKKTQVNVTTLLHKQFKTCTPLAVYMLPTCALPPRITLVTDSISTGSFYGGVGTAVIFAALLAEAKHARLRIVTRAEPGNSASVAHILDACGIQLSHELECVFSSAFRKSNAIDAFDDEIFITTSWWSTEATMASIRHENIIYLLQEDERMFYPYGDMHLRCEQTLKSTAIQYVVNTKLLFDYLVDHGLPHLIKLGRWFEPAFPREVFRRQASGEKHLLMFYARPNHLRNLFYFGIELIEEAIVRGIIDTTRWDIALMGKDIPKLVLANGMVPKCYEDLRWTEYGALIGQVDLGLSLMYTPHPSYPPLDFAAAGAVAVTNRFANKRDLSCYSKNILCGDLDKESMLSVLAQGLRLASNSAERESNYRESPLASDWRSALAELIAYHARVR